MSVGTGLRRLGDPRGKTERQWVVAMRRSPNEIRDLDDGTRLLRWCSGRYLRQHIDVVFDRQHLFVEISRRYQC